MLLAFFTIIVTYSSMGKAMYFNIMAGNSLSVHKLRPHLTEMLEIFDLCHSGSN